MPLPTIGEWLWACRAAAEGDLVAELTSLRVSGQVLQPGLVSSNKRPTAELVFARQGMPVQALCAATCEAIAETIYQAIAKPSGASKRSQLHRPCALHVFSADSEVGNRLAARITDLRAALFDALRARGLRLLADGPAAHAESGLLVQVCLLDAETAVCGVQPAAAAPSLFPGGVQRVRRPREAPSRSAHKLVEALAWLGHGPEAGELCVDLGAAPGGWSHVLADRRCQVLAVDPGKLAPAVEKRVHHLRKNAFDFAPDEPIDWLLCDMAYRPLEVAALLARWGRHRWARFLLANIKLPMNKRVEMLARVREILATGGWTGLRVRQLYHDRDEVTLFAWRGFGLDTRTPAQLSQPLQSAGSSAKSHASPSKKANSKQGPKQGPKRVSKSIPNPRSNPRSGSEKPSRPAARKPKSGPRRRPGVR